MRAIAGCWARRVSKFDWYLARASTCTPSLPLATAMSQSVATEICTDENSVVYSRTWVWCAMTCFVVLRSALSERKLPSPTEISQCCRAPNREKILNKRGSSVLLPVYNTILEFRDGRIVIFCRIPDSVNRRLISGRFRIRIFDVTLPLVYAYKITANRVQCLIFL